MFVDRANVALFWFLLRLFLVSRQWNMYYLFLYNFALARKIIDIYLTFSKRL